MATRILLIGKSGRLDCLADALFRSPREKQIYIISEVDNPGLSAKAVVRVGQSDNPAEVIAFAQEVKPHFAVIGPEEPLAAGIVDYLAKIGIPSVGPRQALARLESSKAFTRELLAVHSIAGNPEHRVFRSLDGLETYLRRLGEFVIKPDGLTGGKGVQVFGDHFNSVTQGIEICRDLLASGSTAVVIEEKLDGEEFSLQSLFDGEHILHTMPIQDHKRANEDDTGPNTGGMGSYSFADHSLPFLTPDIIREAEAINLQVGQAMLKETGQPYKGVLYGGFMVTREGLRVIEYNARFGDPEVMNALALLEGDFIEICEAIINGTLDQVDVSFRHQATVCKYIVPRAYPGKSSAHTDINVTAVTKLPGYGDTLRMYYAAVKTKGDALYLTGSRAMAVVGIGDDLAQAEAIAEHAAQAITGRVRHRKDIGTAALLQKRLDHMAQIAANAEAAPLRRAL